MKVTLIRPHYFSCWESLACGSIASYLKRYYKGDLELQFFDGFFDDDKQIIEGSVDSDYVCFSCTSPQMKHALFLAEKIKAENPRVTTVFGGHHPSSLPKETEDFPNVDIVVVGEGETGMLAVLNLQKIEGIWRSRTIENLDTVPYPDRKLIRQDRTLALTEKNDGERIASASSSRVCPFNCIFCTGDHDVFGYKIRHRSVWHILDEMEQLVNEWHIDFLKFVDAELNSSKSWLQEFCEEKIRQGITVPFGCNIHAAIMDYDTLELMHKANCRDIWVGCESGSPPILKEIQKGLTVEQIVQVFLWAKQVGIRRRAYFMVGFPSETREDFKMTLDLAERIDADVYGCTILCPYPGTALYDATLHANVNWSAADEYHNDFWRTKNLTNEELKTMQSEFMDKFKDRLCFRQKKV